MRRAAEATLYASASAHEERGRSPYRAATAVLAMLILAVVAGLVFATALRHLPPGGSGPPTPLEAKPAQPPPRK
jgi:hypothetical protein